MSNLDRGWRGGGARTMMEGDGGEGGGDSGGCGEVTVEAWVRREGRGFYFFYFCFNNI